MSPEELDALLSRGWRRFGPAYFRPACTGCSACVPLRVPVARFRPSKTLRRVRNKAAAPLRVEAGKPRGDDTRLELYHRWHAVQGDKRDWPKDTLDAGAANRALLEAADIDWLFSRHNLGQAPNGTPGQHGQVPQGQLLDRRLPQVGSRSGIIGQIDLWRDISANRRRP